MPHHNAHSKDSEDFLLSSYDYVLPQSAIAQSPSIPRESAKLLVYERKSDKITHSDFYHFSDFIPKDTLLVFNNTKVINARIYAHKLNSQAKPNPKRMEIFFHKVLDSFRFLVQIKGRVKSDDRLILESHKAFTRPIIAQVLECCEDGMRIVEFMESTKTHSSQENRILNDKEVFELFNNHGYIPLPPYIKRDEANQNLQEDSVFYQSVFAKELGSVAAPTASLHFSKQSLESLQKSFQTCFVTLHIGAGTFINVESEDIRNHAIHKEYFSISSSSAKAITHAKKVLCVGTTSARCVEYMMRYKVLCGECDIFLYPGVEFKRVDYLLTNFHLPKSTLIMLVSAMVGREKCLELYNIALEKGYKFYSYGDGILIL
ncbi:tRNA preQ1(34) S-adenosylmethionine ribosyltransferase-isomerase QueA [Helicobacter cinaedi]|uniref:tRNA preQ1(34) S-adenosylmethionine ribosyltransferase-isomerase QueA n=1 Tax=Helicobacter cinaedi TaxID=213 RepID=UPI000CF07FC8|nr:tRNA preQ1(34) S-adenosylmethionine ribosyltransferase-isomerase QueA [Helicobacter cinaedi]AWK61495.1 tRNA preQ1(34) S-adenosylmethionine ribosyltransferase-isomerase QueA [Helicobacter cinaedi]QOQ95600.1 tRNA preQ1(34) S-adenosylmethionine ribosyltransferase-isomerase QueA [Helicobacter cinaedi]